MSEYDERDDFNDRLDTYGRSDDWIGYCDMCSIETEWLAGAPNQLCDDCFCFCEKNDLLNEAVLWHKNWYEEEFGKEEVERFLNNYEPPVRPDSADKARPARIIHTNIMAFLGAPDLV